MQFWCKLLVLSLCARRACVFAELSDVAVNENDDVQNFNTENTALATTEQYYRRSRWQRHNREGYVAESETRMSQHDYQDEEEEASPDHHDVPDDNTKSMSKPRVGDYWNGYYDFLINEGSYKFWAVFQLATAALLIYSGFAALYYAKINPQITEDYEDYLLRRRRRRRFADWDGPPSDRPFFGFRPETLQRIIDAIAEDVH